MITDFDPAMLQVMPGLLVKDLKSREECDQATIRVELEIEGILTQFAKADAEPGTAAPGWRAKAQAAIRWKRRTIKAIREHAATLPSPRLSTKVQRQEILIDTFRQELGDDEFDRIKSIARSKYPAAFSEATL